MAKPKAPEKNADPVVAASSRAPEPKGAAPMRLPATANQLLQPKVSEATANNTLPPMKVTAGTDLTITAAIASGVEIKVYWAIRGREAKPVFTALAQGTGSAGVQVPIPAWVIGFCIGHTLTIWYETADDSSVRLDLFVEVIDPSEMPAPTFLDLTFADGSRWLDMKTFPGNARVELCAWPFVAAGQRLWVEAVGNEHLSPYRFNWILEDHVVTAQQAHSGFCFLLDIVRAWLAANEDWSSVTIHSAVTYDGVPGTAPEDPSISHIPANAHPLRRATANLRLGEPELILRAPTVREATYVDGQGYLINPANAVDGLHVVVEYDGMRPGDVVCLTFEGTPGAGSPTVPCVEVQQGQTSLEFHLPPSAASHNFGERVTASYTVQRGKTWPSPPFQAQVLNPVDLTDVTVEEATDGKLCLNNFLDNATAIVPKWDYIALGQLCWMWIVGKLEDGSPFLWSVLDAESVCPEWLAGGVSTALDRQSLEKLADCLVFDIHFAVNFRGKPNQADAIAFRSSSLQLVQADLQLEAPSVREAVGRELTVWNGRDGVTVRVQYPRMSPHHTLTVCWKQAGVCLPLPSQPGNLEPGYVDFPIPREAVIHGIGKTVSISFSVVSRCKQQTSPALELDISVPVPMRLPTPVVPQATPPAVQDGILDMAAFSGDADIIVYSQEHERAWWFALAGQSVWLKCTGTKKDGTPHTFYAVQGRLLTAQEASNGLKALMSRAELDLLKHDTGISFTCLVAPDGNELESNAIVFPTLRVIIRKPLECKTEDFESLPLGRFGEGNSVQTPLMKITFEAGSGVAGIVTYGNDQFYSGKHFVMCENEGEQNPPQLHRIDFPHALESIRFAWSWKQAPATVTFYNQAGGVITKLDYDDDWRGGFWVKHVTEPGTAIAWMTILVRDYSFIDNFEMCYRV